MIRSYSSVVSSALKYVQAGRPRGRSSWPEIFSSGTDSSVCSSVMMALPSGLGGEMLGKQAGEIGAHGPSREIAVESGAGDHDLLPEIFDAAHQTHRRRPGLHIDVAATAREIGADVFQVGEIDVIDRADALQI